MSLPLWEECAWYVEVPEIEEEELKYEDLDKEYVEYEEEVNEPQDPAAVKLFERDPLTGLLHNDDDISIDICNDVASVVDENEQLLEDDAMNEEVAATAEVDCQDKEEEKEEQAHEQPGDEQQKDVNDEEEVGQNVITAEVGAEKDGTQDHDETDHNSPEHDINEILHTDNVKNEGLEDMAHELEEHEEKSLHEDEEHENDEHENSVKDEVCTENDEFETVDISVDILETPDESVPEESKHKFPINKSINKRMYLYLGEIYKIPCDAIVIGQVESLLDRHDGNDVIFTLAGLELEPQLAALAPCQTGDSVITTGGQMPCEYIIHSVGPKYDEKYLNASDHALFSAYKSALLLAAEKEVSSLIIGTIYKQTKNYPRFDAAHVALRTVRKFLEHSIGSIFQRIMFCVTTQEDFEIYSALMHAYFPRTEEDLEDQINLLPIELGDEWGEVKIPDRVVKLSVGPKPLPKESLEEYKHHSSRGELVCSSEESKDMRTSNSTAHTPKKLGMGHIKSIGEGPPRSMTQADQDPDYVRQKKVRADFAKMSREERLSYRFQAMLRDIEEEDLDDLDALKLVHFLGKDFKERTVVYLSGANLMRAETMDRHRVLLYLLKRMEAVRCVPFVLIYDCATLGDASYPDTEFMQSVFDLFGCRYNDTLMKFYILHASFSFRMYFWLLLPMETTMYWSSYTNLTSVRSMRHYMDISTLELPPDLIRYDQEHYPDPEAEA